MVNTTDIESLTKQAIKAAQLGQWTEAAKRNEEILDTDAGNVSALNRLGFCYLQLQKPVKAKQAYTKVLTLDPYNPIASKYLKLKGRLIIQTAPGTLSYQDFIEEPGKTKTTGLARLADPSVLSTIAVATPVQLVAKKHHIAVETAQGTYLGALPDDLAFRLQKFLRGGNQYRAVVKSINKTGCIIFIKEEKRGKKFAFVPSFPAVSIASPTSRVHESLLVQDTELSVPEQDEDERVRASEDEDQTQED